MRTRYRLLLVAASALLTQGCAQTSPQTHVYPVSGISDLAPNQDYPIEAPGLEFTSLSSMSFAVQGANSNTWFSPRRLDGKARIYVASHSIPFDFTNTSAQVWLYNAESDHMAVLSYDSGLGKTSLMLYFDRQGNITKHWIGTAVCGYGD